MIQDIESQKDNVKYVLVFKLSRFGRNAADVLTSLQKMQDFGVNLICVEDGIDSSKDSGKLMISVLSSVAEIERENILVQTMEGRRQKAREGKWNGGFAPYGYKLDNGYLVIEKAEAEVIRVIFDLYIHTNMGVAAIAAHLNSHGYEKKKRQNGTLDAFASSFVKGVIDNPVYCGKLAYGRRKTEKIPGKRNAYHIIKQNDYDIYDGVHQPIVSEDDWNAAHEKRLQTGHKCEKTHSLDHEHILSSILRCPVCGAGMYGNVSRKRRPDGTPYKDYFYYACKHRRMVDGHVCTYKKHWEEEKINAAVSETIRKLVSNRKFADAIKEKINSRIDTDELDTELNILHKQLQQVLSAKNKLTDQIDTLDVLDKNYNRKYQDMQERLDNFYIQIGQIEDSISVIEARIHNLHQQKLSGENIYKYLLYFDLLYDKMTDKEKKQFMGSFLSLVEIFDIEQPNGQVLKHLQFAFPVFYNGKEVYGLCSDSEMTVETVCCLYHQKICGRVVTASYMARPF